MSGKREIKTRVGSGASAFKLIWKSVPRGPEGIAHVQVVREGGELSVPGALRGLIEVRWRVDASGIWILMPYGVFGFNLQREWEDSTGEVRYQVNERGTEKRWLNIPFLQGDLSPQTIGAANKQKATRIKAQMPGKLIRVKVTEGQVIEKDQPLFVMEAMKMENEIRAPQAGRVSRLKAEEGLAVESGAELLWIEPVG